MESKFNVSFTERAVRDIDEISAYISGRWSEKVKMNFLLSLTDVLLLLEETPFMFKNSLKKRGVREAIINKNYVLFYQITAPKVEILTIKSTKQNSKKLKF